MSVIRKKLISLALIWVALIQIGICFIGDDFELECPDECDCHYFRVNWVTDCSESNLTEIPYDELSPNVYILDVNGNNISEIRTFPKHIKMRRLQMAHNLLTKIEKHSFEGLEYLIDVDLSANQILSIDPETFVDCPGLLSLELQDNLLENVEGPFLISNSLQYLDISSCNFSDLSVDFFTNVTALHYLDLSKNPLNSIGLEAFDPLSSLDTLILNGCRLREIDDYTFSSLLVLNRLEIADNVLTEVDLPLILGPLGKLDHLNLKNSRITYLPDETFTNTTYLRTLILADNELQYLELGGNLPYLESLDLSNCHLRGFISKDAFVNSTKLKILYLSGNHLQANDLQIALEPLHSLEKIYLRNCSLQKLPDLFGKLKELHELDISYNPLVDAFINILSPLEKLEYLNMGFSNLSHIGSDTFSKMASMKKLILSGNDLHSLEAGLFANLTHLQSLELNYCGLNRPINATLFFKNFTYTELTDLKLAGNPLIIAREYPLLPKQLSRLKSLDLSYCNFTYLPDNAFVLNEMLIELNLAGNRLNSQNGLKFLQLLPKLEKLDLGSNNMTTISPQSFIKNGKITWLNLVGNPWKCDCNIAEMWDWAAMVRGDLGILVGSKTSSEDFIFRGAKRKKSLICQYTDDQIKDFGAKNRTVPGRRPFAKPQKEPSMNRTWSKYVRESGCEQVVKIIKSMPLTMAEETLIDNSMPVPILVLSCMFLLIMFTVFVVLTTVRKCQRNKRLQNSIENNINLEEPN